MHLVRPARHRLMSAALAALSLLLLTLPGCATGGGATRDDGDNGTLGPLLWEIRSPSGVTSWLYGQVFTPPGLEPPWTSAVTEAWARCEVHVATLDETLWSDGHRAEVFMRHGMLSRPLHQTLDETLRARYFEVLEALDLDVDRMSYMRPIFAAATIFLSSYEQAGFVEGEDFDEVLQARARDGKRKTPGPREVVGLERYEELMQAFVAAGDEVGHLYLRVALDMTAKERIADAEQTLVAWQRGDLAGVEQATFALLEREPSLSAHYEAIYQSRNHDYTDRLAGRLGASRRAHFVALDAGHLVGPDNVIDLLRRRGFAVVRVRAR